jgi:hypothetical protein
VDGVSDDDIDLTRHEPLDEPFDEQADDALLAELQLAGELHDPVPAAVVASARASLTWLTIDAELAELAFDSSVDESPVLVRGPVSDEQQLTFETERVAVDLQVTGRGASRRIIGQLAPAGVAEIELRTGSSDVIRVTSDELGRVPAVDVPAGPLSLRIQFAGEDTAVVTDWVTV